MRLHGITDNMMAKIAQSLEQPPQMEEQFESQPEAPQRDVVAEAKAIWEEMLDLADARLQAILAEDDTFGTELYRHFQDTYVKEHDTFLGI